MAVASYDSDLTSANSGVVAVGNTATDGGTWDESSNASWDDQGAPGDETNFYINLANCISAQATKDGQGTILYDHTGDVSVDSGGAVLLWGFWASPASLNIYSSGGLKFVYGEDVGNFWAWDCSGSDFEPNPLGGWYCYALDPAIASPSDTVGTVSGDGSCMGLAVNCSAQARGYPFAVNAIRVGRCTLEVTAGDTSGYGTFAGMESFDTSTNLRYGLFQSIYGSYRWQGLMSLGTTGTAVDFRDSNASINVANTPNVTSTFNKIEISNTGSNVEWSNVVMSSPGVNDATKVTASPGSFEVVENATVDLDSCTFTDMTTFDFLANTTCASTFNLCGQITAGGADLNGSTVLASTVAADNGAVYWNTTGYTDTNLDNMTFTMGSNDHHAIDFSTGVTSNFTLRGCEFTGFGSTGDSNDSTVRFLGTTGSLTLSLVDCTVGGASATTGNFSVDDAAGITVSLSIDPVTTLVHVNDHNGDNCTGAYVWLKAASSTGDLPFEDSVTSILRSGTTATVTHTAHGLKNNEYVKLEGITDKTEDNAGAHQVTVSSSSVYTYTTTDSGSTGYQGTILATGATIYGTSDSVGDISSARTYASDQKLTGFIRKSSTSPRFKSYPLDFTVDASDGRSVTAQLILDE